MAAIENLCQLEMTQMEALLKGLLESRKDIQGHILTTQELTGYIQWMIQSFGQTYGEVTRDMLPYFTPDNHMTRLAAQVAQAPSPRLISQISRQLAAQDEEGYIASGRDIAIGRMLRYLPDHWHSNTYFTLYYVFSGECPLHFREEVLPLKKGSVAVVAPGVVHACPCEADDAVLAFYMIRSSTFRQVFWNQLGDDNLLTDFFHKALSGENPSSYLWFETGSDEELIHLLTRIYEEHQLSQRYADQMLNALMRVAFLLILRKYEGTARLPRTEDFYWKHQFSAILSYIQTHFAETSREEVAARFHYSSRQIGRIVQDCTGKSFGQLTKELKMKRAAELLREGRLSPEQISALVGYSTVPSFYRAFREAYGCSPVAWASNR